MLTAERYVTLLNHFSGPESTEMREVEVALEDLTELFHCTERNVKLIIRKLQEEELIEWHPGRGRGHRSRLVFRIGRPAFLLQLAQTLAQKGNTGRRLSSSISTRRISRWWSSLFYG